MSSSSLPVLLPPKSLPRSPSVPHVEWTPKKYLTDPQPPPLDDMKITEQELINSRQLIDGKLIKKTKPRRTVDYNSGMGRWGLLLPPKAYPENASTSLCTKFVHTSTNKIRCPINVVTWTPEARRVLTGSTSGEFTLWNGLTFNFETILQAHDTGICAMQFTHSGAYLASTDKNGVIKYFEPNMNNLTAWQGSKSREPIRGLSFSPDDRRFATASDDSTIKIWAFEESREESTLTGHGWDVKCVQWHPTKGLLVSGSKDNTIKFWDPRTGTVLSSLHPHKNTVQAIAWSPNGDQVASASRDQTVRVFDIRAMKEFRVLKGHKKEVCSVAWHPVHPVLVSGGSEGSIIHWDVSTADSQSFLNQPNAQSQPRATLAQAHDSNVWCLAFHPLGHLLASGSNDHTTRFWSRERPGDSSSVFSAGGQKPPEITDTTGQDDEDDAMVPGMSFGQGWWSKPEENANDGMDTGGYGKRGGDGGEEEYSIPGIGDSSSSRAMPSQQHESMYGNGNTHHDEWNSGRGGGDDHGSGWRGGGGGGGGGGSRQGQGRWNNRRGRLYHSIIAWLSSMHVRLFPTQSANGPTKVALSVIDCTTARYAPTSGIWVFRSSIDAQILGTALSKVLDSYPHWSGHLNDVQTHTPTDHTLRYGRLFVEYGTETDPGVDYTVAASPREVASFLPNADWRSAPGRCCDVSNFPVAELVSPTPLAILSGAGSTHISPVPSMSIRLTSFACGSVAIGVKMSHPLADARSLMLFMRHWASLYRSSSSGVLEDSLPVVRPFFEPSLLDAAASGDIDSPIVDESLVKQSRSLPGHRYDWLKSSEGCPSPLLPSTVTPEAFVSNVPESMRNAFDSGDPIPWDELDMSATIQHQLFHFTPAQLSRIYEATVSLEPSSHKISYLDALLSNIWFAINRVRYGPPSDRPSEVFLNQTLSLRGQRLSTVLPENVVGSPVLLARVSFDHIASTTPSTIAQNIRAVLTKCDSTYLGAKLYDKAMESGPPWRIWHGFVGKRNLLVSSWIGEGAYELDFGGKDGVKTLPIYAEGVMPAMDGLIQLADAASEESVEGGRWYHKGVDVSIHLPKDIMEQVITDLQSKFL
ncbi:hypothetical protein ONZ45_g4667 [Pleurotus djamor]|nr:hypothetical protein ONZ45_g4667 [Pleurotus djamor]